MRVSTNDIRFAVKLPIIIASAALIVALAIGIASFLTARSQVHGMIGNRMAALLDAKKSELSAYLRSIEQDLRVVATNPTAVAALKDFRSAWSTIGGNETEVLQDAYIDKNPHPTGQKEKLDRGNSGTSYDQVHARYHPWFRKLLRERQYYDVFLFDLQGNLVYTVFKELDYATNLNSGKWKDTDLGNAFRAAALSDKPGSIHFFDFKPYAPSHNAPASFMSAPIYENDRKVGVLVFQMPIDVINTVMSQKAGLGTTGEIMIVGADKLMRNDSRFTKGNDILQTKVANAAVAGALGGKIGRGRSAGYRELDMEFVAVPFTYRGTTWALVAGQAGSEIATPVVTMRDRMLLIGLGLLAMIGVIGTFISRAMTRPITALVGQMTHLAEKGTDVELTGEGRGDEIGDMTRAVGVFRDHAVERARLEAENEKDNEARQARQQRVDALIADFREAVKVNLETVGANTHQLERTVMALAETADRTSEQAGSATAASDEASRNVQAVAAASEELATSIDEISRQVSATTDIVGKATVAAESSDAKVASLADAAQKIGQVVSLIQEIAEQTNLLALNATIEAARAGDSGKGFAVVAAEVKELATQTGKATEEIGSQIANIQSETDAAVIAIREIAEIMKEVNANTSSIAAAVEEQGASTAEISRNVQQAAVGSETVSENVAGVTAGTSETAQSAGQMRTTSHDVSERAQELRGVIDEFLEKVAAA